MGNAGWLLLRGILALRSLRLLRSAASLILTKSPNGVSVTSAEPLRETGNTDNRFARYDVCIPQLLGPPKVYPGIDSLLP